MDVMLVYKHDMHMACHTKTGKFRLRAKIPLKTAGASALALI